MVGINSSDMKDFGSSTEAIFNNYYPQGKMLVKNTSYAKEGVSSRTLTSRSVSDVFTNMYDSMYTNVKFPMAFYNQAISSTVNSFVTASGEVSFSSSNPIQIENPDSINPTTVSGGIAYSKILSDSILGKKAGESIVGDAINKLYSSQLSIDENYIDINGVSHNPNIMDETNSSSPSAGAREIALDSEITDEERSWLLERGKVLAEMQPAVIDGNSKNVLLNGFSFDIPNEYTTLKYMDGKSRFPNISDAANIDTVSSDIISAGVQKAYICPAMIEFLINLNQKIHIFGNLSTNRGSSAGIRDGTSASNHLFGRAIDIFQITDRSGNSYNISNNGTDVDVYRSAFETFMSAVNSMPDHLKPDMIIIGSHIAQEYGIIPGTEESSAKIFSKYPGCKYIGFHPDPGNGHRDHIHVGFSAARSGIYTGSGGSFTINPIISDGGNSPVYGGILPTQGDISSGGILPDGRVYIPGLGVIGSVPGFNPKFTQASVALTKEEVFDVLSVVTYPELAALFTATSAREGNVGSYNTRAMGSYKSRSGGDISFGMLQFNMLAHGNKKYTVVYPEVRVVEGWKLVTKSWQSLGLTDFNSWKNYIFEKYESIFINGVKDSGREKQYKAEMKAEADSSIWYPINQAYFLYTVVTNPTITPSFPLPLDQRLGASPQISHVIGPWGDYGGGPYYGPISNVRWENAVNIYTKATGKSQSTLTQWVKAYFSNPGNGAKSKSAPYIDQWTQGWFFPSPFISSTNKYIQGTPEPPK